MDAPRPIGSQPITPVPQGSPAATPEPAGSPDQQVQAPTGPTGGEVFGIIVLVLFLVGLVAFIGGYVYNYLVLGERGLDAIPFVTRCRRRGTAVRASLPSIAHLTDHIHLEA